MHHDYNSKCKQGPTASESEPQQSWEVCHQPFPGPVFIAGIFIRRLWLSFSQMSFSQLSSFHSQLRSYLSGRPVMTFCDMIAQSVTAHDLNDKEAASKEGRMEDVDASEASLNEKMDGSFGGSLTEFTSNTRARLSLSGLQAAPPARFVKTWEMGCHNGDDNDGFFWCRLKQAQGILQSEKNSEEYKWGRRGE